MTQRSRDLMLWRFLKRLQKGYYENRFEIAARKNEEKTRKLHRKRKKRKQNIDKMAAVIILQGYLDSLR